MINIAVLGGTGHVGKTVVDEFKQHKDYTVFVVTRKVPEAAEDGVSFLVSDYSDYKALAKTFEENYIDTVISCLVVTDDTVYNSQKAAIQAADESSVTKRFISSNWANPNDENAESNGPWARFQIQAKVHLRTTSLIWTELATGYFLDFWGKPWIKSHMGSSLLAIDIKNRVAAIPGSGSEYIPFAYSFDVVRFIATHLLKVPGEEWQETTLVLGDRLTWGEFLSLAEDARGSKFKVTYDSIEALAAGKMTELPNHVESYPYFPKEILRGIYTALEILMAQGRFDLQLDSAFNIRKFPDFKMLTVKEMLEQTWKVRGSEIP